MAMLEVKDLEVYYGVIQAIKGVSFEVNQGEVIALIGANGAGKTTILHTITGLLSPKKGQVLFEGKEVVLIPDNEEECKYIYSTYLEKYLLNNSDSKSNKYVYKLFGARTEEIDSSLKQLDKFKSCSYSYTTDETGDTRIVLKCAPRMSQSTIDEINALLIENFKDSLYSS